MQEKPALRTLFLSLAAVYLVIMCFTGLWPWLANPYNSYALQAQAWLQGRLDLGINYTHLELAIFRGHYYVGFPPFPSMVLLPFVLIFGAEHSPDNMIVLAAAFLAAWYAFRIARQLGRKPESATFWALFVTIGGNFLFISCCGWVLFMAQTLCFALCLAALHYALTPRFRDGFLALGLFACAIGCRPLQALYFPVLAWLLLEHKLPGGANKKMRGLLWLAIPVTVLAGFALLNFARFGSIWEFGDNYLPEFANAPLGQLNLAYIPQNLALLLHVPSIADGKVQFPGFNGFAFYLASPLFLCLFMVIVWRFWQKQTLRSLPQILIPGLLLAHLVVLAAHKTLGGWQFGNRYTVDALPFVLLGIMLLKSDRLTEMRQEPIQRALFLFGLALNLTGCIAVYNHWI